MAYHCNFDSEKNPDECIYVQGFGFEDPSLRPSRNLIRIYANAIGYSLLLFLLLQNVIPYLLVQLVQSVNPVVRIYHDTFLASREVVEGVSIFSTFICYVIPLLTLFSVLRIPIRIAFPKRSLRVEHLIPVIGIILGSSAVGSSFSILISSPLGRAGLHPTGPSIPISDTPLLLLLSVISYALLPAIFEELLFRGVILQSLRRFGDPFALVCTSLLFALLHRNLVQFPNALLTGLVLGFFVLRTGSLRMIIVGHFVNNLIPVLLQAFSANLSDAQGNLLFLGINAVYVLLAVGGLLFLLRMHPILLRRFNNDGRHAELKKYRYFFSSIPMLTVIILLSSMVVWNMLG